MARSNRNISGKNRPARTRLAASIGALFLGALTGAAAPAEIIIPDTGVFPESVTSTPDGAVIFGSFKGVIYRAPRGQGVATPWIASGTNGLLSVSGVLADSRANTLWVCSGANARLNLTGAAGEPTEFVKAFDLKTGAPKGSSVLPGGGIGSHCNDLAVAADGTVYATDTPNGRVLRLKPGAAALEEWAKDPKLAGANGIAVMDGSTLYVGSVANSKIVRVKIGAGGAVDQITELHNSEPMGRPDGMRAFGPNRIMYTEPSGLSTTVPLNGRLMLITIEGDNAMMKVIKDGYSGSPSSLTFVGDQAWVTEGKMAYLNNPALQGKDPSPFKATPVSIRGLR